MQLLILHEATLEDIERKIPVFMQKYFGGEESEETLDLIRQLAELDPTNGKYTEWVIKQYKDETFIIPEDNEKISKSLAKFHKIKSRLDDKDINSYTPGSLAKALGQHGGESKRQERKLGRKGKLVLPQGAELVLDDEGHKAVKVTTPKAASLLCSGTQWCTANLGPAKTYLESGLLYLIYVNNKRKYLVHYETSQFMDIHNEQISNDDKLKFVEWLKSASGKTIHNEPHLAYWYAKEIIKGRWLEGEQAIMKRPITAARYASNVIKGRWPEGEQAIMGDPRLGYLYAKHVIKGRWPEAEPTIMKSSTAEDYAQNIIKGRWPEAEPAIMKSPIAAVSYAQNIIKGRWPEAEPGILKSQNHKLVYKYVREVIKDRWSEAEPVILKDPWHAALYAAHVMRGRWPEAEPAIAKHPRAAIHYATHVIKNLWPEAEPVIMQSIERSVDDARDFSKMLEKIENPSPRAVKIDRYIKQRWWRDPQMKWHSKK